MRHVGVCGWVVATARESDADYHLILSNGSRQFMNAEISGIPDSKKDRDRLIAVRNEFEAFVEESGRSTGSYKGWKDPVPVYIEGSLFWDIEHGPGEVGPAGALPLTAWEIHPIAKIEFESNRCR